MAVGYACQSVRTQLDRMDAFTFQRPGAVKYTIHLPHEQLVQLLDGLGKRLYFGVDHTGAAEQVLMKILFPLNQ